MLVAKEERMANRKNDCDCCDQEDTDDDCCAQDKWKDGRDPVRNIDPPWKDTHCFFWRVNVVIIIVGNTTELEVSARQRDGNDCCMSTPWSIDVAFSDCRRLKNLYLGFRRKS